MRRAAAVLSIPGLLLLTSISPGQATGDAEFVNSVQKLLAGNCVGCHNTKSPAAGLNLEAVTDVAATRKLTGVWPRVLDKVSSGAMPPAGMPRPSKDQVDRFTAWIKSNLDIGTSAAPSSPPEGVAGRVTMRRLNRTEYNNTIHDLLGLTINPADDFPMDDSGYGFDNIGDVLSLSPLLMEKYIAAATRRFRSSLSVR